MADLDVNIAGRIYRVACEDGQEPALAEAAGLIGEEAEELRRQFGDSFASLSETRALLMAALMLADRHRLQAIEIAETRAAASAVPPQPAPSPAAAPQAPALETGAQPALFDEAAAGRAAELEAALEDALERAEAAERALAAAREDAPEEENGAAAARIDDLSAELDAARAAEDASISAVEEATRRVRALIADLSEAA